ncbi:MAG: phosphoribosylglycinamide formyltransferase-1 [Arenicella sp.]|jgi:phosphoribosylglycinamide formyltransferase-1
MSKKIKIAILASGGGSNAEEIVQHFDRQNDINIELVISNNAGAYVLKRAENHDIQSWVHTKEDVLNGAILKTLEEKNIDFIVLAGYLKKIGDDLIESFPNKIINVHPALLPKFGGKGMYGMNVHKAVVAAGENVSGPTIHFVNENYDEGAIIEQHEVKIEREDSAEDVQTKVLKLEHAYFAKCIERIIREQYEI